MKDRVTMIGQITDFCARSRMRICSTAFTGLSSTSTSIGKGGRRHDGERVLLLL